jgi:hypothetical protein
LAPLAAAALLGELAPLGQAAAEDVLQLGARLGAASRARHGGMKLSARAKPPAASRTTSPILRAAWSLPRLALEQEDQGGLADLQLALVAGEGEVEDAADDPAEAVGAEASLDSA